MHSTLPSRNSDDRPAGVTAVFTLMALAGLGALILAVLLALHVVPLSSGALLLQGGFEQSGPLAFLIYASLTSALAWGLWARRGLARRLTILMAAIGVAFAVPSVSSAVADGRPFSIAREGLQIMIRVAVIYYLSQQPVRDWFATRQP